MSWRRCWSDVVGDEVELWRVPWRWSSGIRVGGGGKMSREMAGRGAGLVRRRAERWSRARLAGRRCGCRVWEGVNTVAWMAWRECV